MHADKWIVITTINLPTTALHRFAAMAEYGWATVVVGDLKTPADWALAGCDYLGVKRQEELYGELSRLIPTRHYARKNLGYLYAIEHGARLIVDTDDDNIPYASFGQDLAVDVAGRQLCGPGWANVYQHFTTHPHVWPRGLPLDAINRRGTLSPDLRSWHCPVQQFLADGDPDVDAIYRLVFQELVNFDQTAAPVVLAPDTWVPFNSQNTVFFPEAFPLLYLPGHVSFRMTDIWRSFVAQAALARRGWGLSFHGPTVVQERNVHNFMKDFADEVPGYLHNDAIMQRLAATAAQQPADEPAARLVETLWAALREKEYVLARELDIVKAWQAHLARVMAAPR
ncbi:MAG: STELLO glycosyltransferase family protein [Lentisphaerae bacterium]|nr:STELLO glycosyltransferase family protein [Lentisphaerota bacterium]